MKTIVEEILELDDIIRFVGVIGKKENTLNCKMKEGKVSLLTPREEEIFAMDLEKIAQIRDAFNGTLGKTTFSYLMREKVHMLNYYTDNLIVSVTCEPRLDFLKIREISNKIEPIVKKTNLLLQH